MKIVFSILSLFLLACSCENTVKKNEAKPKGTKVEKRDTDALELNDPKKEDSYFAYDNEYPRNTTVYYEDFSIRIFNYQVQNELGSLTTMQDTLELVEWVGSNLNNRRIEISSQNKTFEFTIEYAFNDWIVEQYNPENIQDPGLWNEIREKWEGLTPYKRLKPLSPNTFKFPDDKWWDYLTKDRMDSLGLKDTLVDLSGENDNVATMLYKGKPALHHLENTYLKITKTHNNQKQVRYLKIVVNRGC
jgi:hypothetical protein